MLKSSNKSVLNNHTKGQYRRLQPNKLVYIDTLFMHHILALCLCQYMHKEKKKNFETKWKKIGRNTFSASFSFYFWILYEMQRFNRFHFCLKFVVCRSQRWYLSELEQRIKETAKVRPLSIDLMRSAVIDQFSFCVAVVVVVLDWFRL